MLGYASRTGTRRNLEALRGAGWGLLVSARGVLRTEGFDTYAIDNGAWTAHQRGEDFDVAAFERAVALLGDRAQFLVLPDIVAGGKASLALSLEWLPRLDGIGVRRLIAVQDGMAPWDVEPHLSSRVGLFVGGSTDWKWKSLPHWGFLARRTGAYLHVGRVNTARRIRECARVGVDSFDGTSTTRFACTLPMLDATARQGALIKDEDDDGHFS